MKKLEIVPLRDNVILPSYGSAEAACFDMPANLKGVKSVKRFTLPGFTGELHGSVPVTPETAITYAGVQIEPGETLLIPTGVVYVIDPGYSLRIHPRSSTFLKKGLMLGNCEGIVDSDYTQEVFLVIHNATAHTQGIRDGDRLCQGELVKSPQCKIVVTNKNSRVNNDGQISDRKGGFGSTGQ